MQQDQQLREYMQATFGGLQEERGTASYALEFLRTSKSNADDSSKRELHLLNIYEAERQCVHSLKRENRHLRDALTAHIKALAEVGVKVVRDAPGS